MESDKNMCVEVIKTTKSYRAEEGERGGGREPPQARNGWRVRSEVVVYWRPPEGAKRPKGCVCGISPEAKGVRTQSRRHLNAVKVETGRGQGAERPARPKLRIDRGGMGGGGSINDHTEKMSFSDIKSNYRNNNAFFSSNRHNIFHYCFFADKDETGGGGGVGQFFGDTFCVYRGNIDSDKVAHVFIHELGHNLLGQNDPTGVAWDHNPLADHFDSDENGDGKYEHLEDGTYAMVDFIPDNPKNNYCTKSWNAMDLKKSLN